MVGRPCKVCGHRNRRKIESAMRTGLALRVAEQTFGISDSAISRHMRLHAIRPAPTDGTTPPQTPAAGREAENGLIRIETAADVLSVVETQVNHYDRLSYRLEREGDINGALKGRRNLVDAVERIFAKYHNVIADQPIIDQRQIIVEQHVAGAPEMGLRGLLRVIERVGEDVVNALVVGLEGRSAAEIKQLIARLADEPKALTP